MGTNVMLLLAVLAALMSACSTLPEFPLVRQDEAWGTDRSKDLARLARDIEANGESETALTLYREAVASSGNTPAAYVRLGDAYLRASKLASAIEAYRIALAKDSDNADALLGLGSALAQQGALEKGLDALAKAAPRVNTGAAYNRLGVAQTMAGRFAEAEASFERGRAIAWDDLDIATNLALAAALAGETDKAAELARKVTQLPAEPRHRRNLVIVLGLIGWSADEARSFAPNELSQRDFEALLARAATIRKITDPKARARALGTMRG
jgi:Flp pilus assembly protein TadD